MVKKAAKESSSKQKNVEDGEEELLEELEQAEIDLYQVLGLAKTATAAEIKKAYRKLALVHHPDKNNQQDDNKDALRNFQELVYAYGVLSDETKRKRYDETGRVEGDEGFGEEGYGWKEFYDDMYGKAVTKEMIEDDKIEYQGTHFSR